MKVPAGLATMNSKELNVNVPLATGESDSEEFEVYFYSSQGQSNLSDIISSLLNYSRVLVRSHPDHQLELCL